MARRPTDRAATDATLGGPFLISTRPPGKRQVALARLVTGVMFGAFLGTLVFRETQLARQDAFIPIANTIVGLNDLLTAVLLYSQFSVTRARALLVLASGFLFKSLILVPHTLTFPGAFSASGLLGAQLQTAAWLYVSQQIGFVLGAIVYTKLNDREHHAPASEERVAASISAAVIATVAAAFFVTWLLTVARIPLPGIMADQTHMSSGFRRVGAPLLVLMSLASVIVLRRRPASMIDLWLQVAVWSWLFEVLLTTLSPGRFTLIFYVGKAIGVVSSGFVLLVLLSESLMLHRRLVLAMASREQEREGHRTAMDVMVGSLAHELRQPLGAILMNGQAGAVMLSAAPGGLDEVRDVFRDIHTSVLRANEIIESVRTMFAHSPHDRVSIETNDLVREAVDIMRLELEAYRVTLDLDLAPELPTIRGHRGQLIQVLMNGVRNGVESLATISDRERQLRVRTIPLEPDGVAIRIEDSGRGLDPAARDRMFEPFFSTKARGMGLGLSICKSIIETHEGALSLLPGSPHGAVFQVELPALATGDPTRDARVGSGVLGSNMAPPTPRPTHASGPV